MLGTASIEAENLQVSREVCVLSTGDVFGGAEIFKVRLAALLREHSDLVVVAPLLPALKTGVAESGARFVGLPGHGWLTLRWALLRWVWRQRRGIRTGGMLVVLNGRGAAYLAPVVRLLTHGAPVIISQTALTMRRGDFKEALYGVAARFARCVVAVSDYVAAQHHQRWPRLMVTAIPNWIDLQSGVDDASRPVSSCVADILHIAVVARLAPEKGVEDVLAACMEEEGVELHVYGDGPMRDPLREAGRELAWLHFYGHVDDLPRRLPTHSVLISGSYSESFSFSVAEGIQAGLLCVVSDIPAHRELLGESYPDELFFPPGDRAALKRALAAARVRLSSADGDDARTVVAAAMSRLRERNSPELARQRYLAVLCRECGEGRAA